MIAWMLETLVATTLLMLLVLALRKPVARQFGPNIAYALWLLPVLRLVIPPLPGAWRFTDLIAPLTHGAAETPGVAMGVLNPQHAPEAVIDAALIQAQVELAGHHADLAVVPPTLVSDGPNLALVLIGLWAIGAALFIAYHLIAHHRFCAGLMRRAKVRRTVADGRVHVIETDAATGPLAFGIWRKYVAFPRDFADRYDPIERNLALAHELGHHLRGDLIANWIALVVLALHWFNPVAWRAFRAFRADQELACDALVLSGRAPALRHAYGRAIVKSAHGGAVSAACHLHSVNELKGRLKMLAQHNPKSRARLLAGITGAVALTLAGLALTASGSQAATDLRDDAGATIGVDLGQIEPPAPPAPVPDVDRVPEVPAAPGVAPVAHAKQVSRVRIVTKGKDGKTRVQETTITDGDAADAMISADGRVLMVDGRRVDIPQVVTGNCGPGKGNVVRETKDGKRSITICADRIDTIVTRATADASRGEAEARSARVVAVARADSAKSHALMSLRIARGTIAGQTGLSAEQKANALKGIDEAMRELESNKD